MYNPFKKKSPKPEFNAFHPDNAHVIEEAFKAGGKTYYRFKEERLIPAGRYKYIYAYLKEIDLKMDIDTLKSYVADFKNLLNGSGAKKIIQIGELWKLVINLESRLALKFDPETVERLASVIYFDDSEELSTFDKKHGAKKIEIWKKHLNHDFFLMKPMGELLGLKNTSTESLEASIQTHLQMIQDLTVDRQKLSLANSSENGKPHS
jgi:hypothetical protein